MGTQNRNTKSFAVKRFKSPIDRYQSLTIRDCLSIPSQYFLASKQLSFLLRNYYSVFPKNLQSLIFQDTLFAFNLLPQMQTQSAISAAKSLLQSAEFALPKQKRAVAVTEHKQAVVASKRKSKANKEQGLAQLPQDVVVHIFGFLDVQSLLSASSVCRSWNEAASDNCLWKSLYDTYFCSCDNVVKNKGTRTVGATKNEIHQIDNIKAFGVDYRIAFEGAYKDACDRNLGYCSTGYCSGCRSIVWLDRNRCSNASGGRDEVNHQIKPVSVQQIAEFIQSGSLSPEPSSDSDSDTEDVYASRLWAYPRHIS